ncbi:MAG: hypothetical protein WBQ43_09715 [Terriglobales bacterium]
MLKKAIRAASVCLLTVGFSAHADQNGTCELDGGRKAHYYCPDGYEVMLAGGGREDCSGRCYKRGSADELKRVIKGAMEFDFHTPISDEQASKIAREMLKTGSFTATTSAGKSVTLRKEEAR